MKNKDNRYPDDWKEIALEIKEKADWTCSKCRLICFPSDFKYNGDRSLRAMLTLTVHHADYDPSNNQESNLIPLCTSCHLDKHRGKRGNISPGQLKLNLGI